MKQHGLSRREFLVGVSGRQQLRSRGGDACRCGRNGMAGAQAGQQSVFGLKVASLLQGADRYRRGGWPRVGITGQLVGY